MVSGARRAKARLKKPGAKIPARGVNVRRLDHLNCLASTSRPTGYSRNYLGLRPPTDCAHDGTEAAMWMTMSNKSYDFAYTRDHYGKKGSLPPRHLPHSTAARKSCAQLTSSSKTASHREPSAQALRFQQTSSSMSTTRPATASKSPMPRPPHPGARLETDLVDRGRAQEGPGWAEDDRVIPTHGTPPVKAD